jgi:hypothetical protein
MSKQSKNRYVDTSFWSDSYIVKKDMIERYLFLYFLTNEHNNIAGVYELPIEVMSRETGLEKDHLEKLLPRLKGKVYFFQIKNEEDADDCSWIFIKNFIKHQQVNEKIMKGIESVLKNLPPKIKEEIKQIGIPGYEGIAHI